MFLKRLERRKNGKRHTYWALVESVRTAGGSRHRVVAYLGELHIEDTWYRRTALDDLVGVASEQVHTDRLYAGLDGAAATAV